MPITAPEELSLEFTQDDMPYVRAYAEKRGLTYEQALSKVVADGDAEGFQRTEEKGGVVLLFRRK